MDKISVEWAKTRKWATTPKFGSAGSVGLDVYAAELHPIDFSPNQRKKVNTRIKINIATPGVYAHIFGRSGWAEKGIYVHPGD